MFWWGKKGPRILADGRKLFPVHTRDGVRFTYAHSREQANKNVGMRIQNAAKIFERKRRAQLTQKA